MLRGYASGCASGVCFVRAPPSTNTYLGPRKKNTNPFGTRAEHFVARIKIVRENLQHFIVTYTASSCSSSVSFYKAHDIHKISIYIYKCMYIYIDTHIPNSPSRFSTLLLQTSASSKDIPTILKKTPAELWGFKQSLMMWCLLRSWNLRCQRARHEVGSLPQLLSLSIN